MPLPGTNPPPVFVTLMKSAPALTCSRTARGSSKGSSTSRPTKYMWPPVVVMTLPLRSSRGPLVIPSRMASRTRLTTRWRDPQSRSVVMPARRAA